MKHRVTEDTEMRGVGREKSEEKRGRLVGRILAGAGGAGGGSGIAGIDFLFYNRKDVLMDGLDVLIRIDDGGATWAARELSKESVADFFEVIDPTFFKAVLAALDSSRSDLWIDIQDDRHIGQAPCGSDFSDLPKRIDIEATGGTLVNDVGKQESIANDRVTCIECRPNIFGDELGSGGHVQEHLGGIG